MQELNTQNVHIHTCNQIVKLVAALLISVQRSNSP